jgi:hypothetical protein
VVVDRRAKNRIRTKTIRRNTRCDNTSQVNEKSPKPQPLKIAAAIKISSAVRLYFRFVLKKFKYKINIFLNKPEEI